LGRADVGQRRVTLASHLNGTGALLEEVLCHELAHIVAFDLVGKAERVHGPTWQRLVCMAGFAPSRRLQCSSPQMIGLHQKRSKRYMHRCQVCGFTRIAGRRMSAWRCADCVSVGLDGRLDVVELEART
jgi:predicted SprT family Zn-dependent metalloprotease